MAREAREKNLTFQIAGERRTWCAVARENFAPQPGASCKNKFGGGGVSGDCPKDYLSGAPPSVGAERTIMEHRAQFPADHFRECLNCV